MHREIAYTVRFPEAAAHRVEIEARVPVHDGAGVGGAGAGGAVELMLPVWTPGSYMVREFARQVETLSAATADGEPLAVAKSRKNRWTVEAGGAAEIVVRYRLYARELSVRASFVDAGFALLNGAATFLTRVDDGLPAAVPHRVALELPAGWAGAFCALPRAGGGPPTTPGSSSTAATRTAPTTRSATTARARWSPGRSTSACAGRAAARRVSTTCCGWPGSASPKAGATARTTSSPSPPSWPATPSAGGCVRRSRAPAVSTTRRRSTG